ncbi:hypothetical protein HAX54_042009 [Datura stramonium]|uniref:Uncharacterized protein n=1 Tax=Datura stramonium TaxID=4076 RepID=A0ABS8W0C1_DATST|nr:hypothetical protein [Datura stramonium]
MEPNGCRKGNKRNLVTIQNGNHSPLTIDEELDPWTIGHTNPRIYYIVAYWCMPFPHVQFRLHVLHVLLCSILRPTPKAEPRKSDVLMQTLWWGKAIMIRNQPLLWVLSIGFELMEGKWVEIEMVWPSVDRSLACKACSGHRSNVEERCSDYGEKGLVWGRKAFTLCTKLADDLLCYNYLFVGCRGIYGTFSLAILTRSLVTVEDMNLGWNAYTVRHFDGRTWVSGVAVSRQPNIMGKVKRTLGQFTPAHWDKDEWHPLLGPWRFLQVGSGGGYLQYQQFEYNTYLQDSVYVESIAKFKVCYIQMFENAAPTFLGMEPSTFMSRPTWCMGPNSWT